MLDIGQFVTLIIGIIVTKKELYITIKQLEDGLKAAQQIRWNTPRCGGL